MPMPYNAVGYFKSTDGFPKSFNGVDLDIHQGVISSEPITTHTTGITDAASNKTKQNLLCARKKPAV